MGGGGLESKLQEVKIQYHGLIDAFSILPFAIRRMRLIRPVHWTFFISVHDVRSSYVNIRPSRGRVLPDESACARQLCRECFIHFIVNRCTHEKIKFYWTKNVENFMLITIKNLHGQPLVSK